MALPANLVPELAAAVGAELRIAGDSALVFAVHVRLRMVDGELTGWHSWLHTPHRDPQRRQAMSGYHAKTPPDAARRIRMIACGEDRVPVIERHGMLPERFLIQLNERVSFALDTNFKVHTHRISSDVAERTWLGSPSRAPHDVAEFGYTG